MNMPGMFAWLILGAIVQLARFGRRMTPLGAWLAPVFPLHLLTRSIEMRTHAALIGLGLVALVATPAALAQGQYPTKSVRLVVPYRE